MSAPQWEYKEITVPLKFTAKLSDRILFSPVWTPEPPRVTFNQIISKHLQKEGADGWVTDGPTDLDSLQEAGRVNRKFKIEGALLATQIYTYESVRLGLKRPIG
jgi:hypothetical protein